MMLSRRKLFGLFGGGAALLAAPSIVRASSLMPTRAFALDYVPCDGRWLLRRLYSQLYAANGGEYGKRAERHFTVPDFRSDDMRLHNKPPMHSIVTGGPMVGLVEETHRLKDERYLTKFEAMAALIP